MTEYPEREKFFSHKFVRLLSKSCAALDIGQHACLLCCYIAHTEDASRYSGPVRYWNEQLMSCMGFRSPNQLIRARTAAVEAGWLVYERASDRQVGRYWVTVPAQFDGLTDDVIEPNHSENGTPSKPKDAGFELHESIDTPEFRDAWAQWCDYRAKKKQPLTRRIADAHLSVCESLGSQEAIAAIERTIKDGRSRLKQPEPEIETEIPESIDTPEFRAAWSLWEAHRRDIKKPLTPTSVRQQLKSLSALGLSRAIASIEHTIEKGWIGLREPESNNRQTGAATTNQKVLSIADINARGGYVP